MQSLKIKQKKIFFFININTEYFLVLIYCQINNILHLKHFFFYIFVPKIELNSLYKNSLKKNFIVKYLNR